MDKTITILKYPGSKRRFIPQINKELEKIKSPSIYIEPFLGSGAVFLNLPINFTNSGHILSEINTYVYRIWKSFQDGKYSDFVDFWNKNESKYGKWGSNKESYYQFRNDCNKKYFKTDTLEEGIFYYCVGRSCCNSLLRWGPNGFNASFGNRCKNLKITEEEFNFLKVKFSNTLLFNDDFFKLYYYDSIYKDENSVWFLDPPYLSSNMTKYNDDCNFYKNGDKFYDMILNIRGKVIYTDLYDEKIEKRLKWRIEKIRDLNTLAMNKSRKIILGEEVMYINF